MFDSIARSPDRHITKFRQAGAVFLDKDGTVVEDVPYNADPDCITLMPGVLRALRVLHEAGYPLIMVTNQSGVAKGLFPEQALAGVQDRIRELLQQGGVPLAGFYYCPHDVHGSVQRLAVACRCRKPAPGLLLAAAEKFGVDLQRSWMVGDILDDIEAGSRAGCRTILIDNGHETEWRSGPHRTPDAAVPDVLEAAWFILTEDRVSGRAFDTLIVKSS